MVVMAEQDMDIERDKAIQQLHRLLDKVQAWTEHISEEEVEQDVRAAIAAVRREKRQARQRSGTAK